MMKLGDAWIYMNDIFYLTTSVTVVYWALTKPGVNIHMKFRNKSHKLKCRLQKYKNKYVALPHLVVFRLFH